MLTYNTKYKLFSLYYTISSLAWLALLIRLGILLPLVGKKFLPGGIADYFLTLQSVCSCLDILSYVTGNVQFNFKLLAFKTITRFFISYGVIFSYPKVARTEYFSLIILIWGLEELINYIYLGYKLKSQNRYKVPPTLQFVYLNNFYLLLPARCLCEMCLTFLSLKFIEDERYKNLIRFTLVLYLPAYYSHFKNLKLRGKGRAHTQSSHIKEE